MKRQGAHAFARRTPTAPRRGVALAALWVAAGAAMAQEAPAGRGLRVAASVESSASYVVNSSLGGRDAGELVLEVRPGFTAASRAGRIVGSMSYGLGLSRRSRNSDQSDSVSHGLAAQFSAEAVERWMFIDGSASISRQSTDPYGLQASGGSAAADSNRQEVATASLSPSVRGALGGAVNYDIRLNASGTNARRSIAGDSSNWGGSASLSSVVTGTALGWGLVATSQETDFRAGRKTRNDRWFASLSWLADTDLSFVLRGGEEATDVGQLEQERYANWGGGVTWRPSPRTRFQLDADERYFGNSYRLVFDHRMARSSFSIGSSRSDNGGQPTRVQVTAFQLLDAQLSTLIPDPVQRQLQVQTELAARGQRPDDVVFVGFLNSAVAVVQRHDFAFSYGGQRLSASVQAYFDKSTVIDSFAGTTPEPVRQKGYTATAGYRLAPDSNLTASLSWLTTLPSSTRAGTNLKTATLAVSQLLGRRTAASASLRYAVFNSSSNPYREAAVTASLSHRF